MNEHEAGMKRTLDYVAGTTRADIRLDQFPAVRRRRVPSPLAAAAAFLIVLGLAVPLIFRFTDQSQGVGAQSTTPSSATTPTSAAAMPIVVGSDVDVSNAVAPFDHESNVDSLLLEFSLANARNQQVFDCIADAGFEQQSASVLPDREDPILMANATFPDIETLAREGFPDLSGTPASPGDSVQRSEAEAEASRACAEEIDRSEGNAVAALGLYASMRSAWEVILAEVEATEEIRSLVDGFGVCLRDRGIPAEFTHSDTAYLGYADSLLMATGIDQSTWPEIRESTGKLYAECGRDLFAARETLRSGPRREVFLSAHDESISQLWDLLLGLGSSPTPDTAATTLATTTTGLGDEALLACMIGSWTLDTEAFEANLQANVDPRVQSHPVTIDSGGGTLDIAADQTFTLSYDQLTIRIGELQSSVPHPDTMMLVSGEVTAGFGLQGNVFLTDDIEGAPLDILRSLADGTYVELPPVSIRSASLRMGTRANHPYYLEKITIGCSGDHLVVNDEVRIDTITGDGPSVVWMRSEG